MQGEVAEQVLLLIMHAKDVGNEVVEGSHRVPYDEREDVRRKRLKAASLISLGSD